MKQIAGIWVPDDDTHFHMYLNRDKGPIIMIDFSKL